MSRHAAPADPALGGYHGTSAASRAFRTGPDRGGGARAPSKAFDDFELFSDLRKGAFGGGGPASIMSISGIAISGRGAPNPASAGAALLWDFHARGKGADGQGTEPMMPAMPVSCSLSCARRARESARARARARARRLDCLAGTLSGTRHAPALRASASSGRCPPLGAAP